MRVFDLFRREDESGVSGVGVVAQGVEFDDGTCVMHWNTATSSIAIYKSVTELVQIHGHQGKTVVDFHDGERVSDV